MKQVEMSEKASLSLQAKDEELSALKVVSVTLLRNKLKVDGA